MNENFDGKNHLTQQIFSPLPLINVALPPKTPDESSVLPNNIE